MRKCGFSVAVVLICCSTSGAFPEEKDSAEIARLVEQLGDDDFEKRQQASRKLEAMGSKALPALVRALTTTSDLEVQRRATKLVRLIMPATVKSRATAMELVGIRPGEFFMGSELAETGRRADEDRHRVRINRPFFLGAYEVTQEEYIKVMKTNPSHFSKNGEGQDKIRGLATARLPVENVSWFDTLEYCNRLSKLDGLEPYYKLTAIKNDGWSISKANVKVLGGNGYRLPTEAEWEYSCRANSLTPYNFGAVTSREKFNVKPLLVGGGYGSSLQWPDLERTEKVGAYKANAWGLYEMHGNVGEWCWDYYDKDYYSKSPPSDPQGPERGNHRVMRGGSWQTPQASARSASRFFLSPGERKYFGGFRVARNP